MEEYRYQGLPITPSIIEELIVQHFNGKSSKRDVIVNKVLEYHIANGGVAPEAQDFPRSVKKALSNLAERGHSENRAYGIWKISKYYFPVVSENIDTDTESPLVIIPSHRVFGVGDFAVYCYYFDNYRRLAIHEGRSIWPCKIGRTDRDPLIRVLSQASTALPEKPIIDFVIKTSDSSLLESAIHSILKLKNRHITDSPGSEWFYTSPNEVLEIIKIVNEEILAS
jgi:hypothetical protein